MDAPIKPRLLLAAAFCALGAGGCAGMGGNKGSESIAAARNTAATPPAVSFTQADVDGDARISREEFDLWVRRYGAGGASTQAAAGGTRERDAFDAADTNLNGVLTLDEWQAIGNNPSTAAPSASRGTPPQFR